MLNIIGLEEIAYLLAGALISLAVSGLRGYLERRRLKGDFRDELQSFLKIASDAAARSAWMDGAVEGGLKRLLDFYRLRNPAAAFQKFSSRFDVYHFHYELNWFIEAKKNFELVDLPLELQLQSARLQYDPAFDPLPRRVTRERVQELLQHFENVSEKARNGSNEAISVLPGIARLLLITTGESLGWGREASEVTRKVRSTFQDFYGGYAQRAYQRLIHSTQIILAAAS